MLNFAPMNRLNLSWRKGDAYPTASELNSIVSKINELVGETSGTSQSGSSSANFDWTSIPIVSSYSKGLMTPDLLELLMNTNVPTKEELEEILADVFVRTDSVLLSTDGYQDDKSERYGDVISAGYADVHFTKNDDFEEFRNEFLEFANDTPSLTGPNTFKGINTFEQPIVISGFSLDNREIKYIQTIDEEPPHLDGLGEDAKEASIPTTWYVENYYLRKDEGDWTAYGTYGFTDGTTDDEGNPVPYFEIGNNKVTIDNLETFGAYDPRNDYSGSGVTIFTDGYNGYIYTDELHVRKTAWFRSVTIEETKHIGGETILSCAYCVISEVKEVTTNDNRTYYVCFFDKEANGKKAYQMWEKGDQARLQQTTTGEDKADVRYYWRVVTGCGDGAKRTSGDLNALLEDAEAFRSQFSEWCDDYFYVILSGNKYEDLGKGFTGHDILQSDQLSGQEGFDPIGTSVPEVNDEIVLLGNRDLNPDKNYRRAAQFYSTSQANSPLRKYYSGIGSRFVMKEYQGNQLICYQPFSLAGCEIETIEYTPEGTHWEVGQGNNYIKYTETGGLEASLTSLNIVVGGSTTNVADALGKSFRIWTSEIDWKATDIDVPAPKKINYGEVFPSEDWTTAEERASHYGDYLVTVDGFAYEFKSDDNWEMSTDQQLIYATNVALEAVQSLEEIADDKVITRQEKGRIRQILQEIEVEHSNIDGENVTKTAYEDAYKMFKAFLSAILGDLGDFVLEDEDGEMCVSISGNQVMMMRVKNNTPTDSIYNFEECFKNYYDQLDRIRKAITKSYIIENNDVFEEVQEQIQTDIDHLFNGLDGEGGYKGVLTLTDDLGALMKAAQTGDGTYFSGFVTNGEYSAMVSKLYATDKDGNVIYEKDENGNDVPVMLASALASAFTYVEDDRAMSGYMINADKILFKGNVGIQGLTYRVETELGGMISDDDIYDFEERNYAVGTDDYMDSFKFYRISYHDDAENRKIGLLAPNFAKTGSYINVVREDGVEPGLQFLLPCIVDVDFNNKNNVDEKIYYKFSGTNEYEINEFFRKQATRYFGNKILIKVPSGESVAHVSFYASERKGMIMPLAISRGLCINKEDGVSFNVNKYNEPYYAYTDMAWLDTDDNAKDRLIVLESCLMEADNYYGRKISVRPTFVLGWKITLLHTDYLLEK